MQTKYYRAFLPCTESLFLLDIAITSDKLLQKRLTVTCFVQVLVFSGVGEDSVLEGIELSCGIVLWEALKVGLQFLFFRSIDGLSCVVVVWKALKFGFQFSLFRSIVVVWKDLKVGLSKTFFCSVDVESLVFTVVLIESNCP